MQLHTNDTQQLQLQKKVQLYYYFFSDTYNSTLFLPPSLLLLLVFSTSSILGTHELGGGQQIHLPPSAPHPTLSTHSFIHSFHFLLSLWILFFLVFFRGGVGRRRFVVCTVWICPTPKKKPLEHLEP